MTKMLIALGVLPAVVPLLTAGEVPRAEISNGQIRATVYLPDAKAGYYRGTRFDWSGVIGGLEYKGHKYYGPWYQRVDPNVHDFIYAGSDIIAGPCSGITGPVEEFVTGRSALGYDEAKAGGSFIKLGVGVLRKPDEAPYDHYRLYPVADPGKWTVRTASNYVEFVQDVGKVSGYAYRYQKVVRLLPGKPVMVLEHSLRNTGGRAIETSVYNHNFLTLDGLPPGPEFTVAFPFALKTARLSRTDLGTIRGKEIAYLKVLAGEDQFSTAVQGFGDTSADYDIRIENRKAAAGLRITGDRPLSRVYLWSIRSVLSIEPYIAMAIEPGSEFSWNLTYEFYTLPRPGR